MSDQIKNEISVNDKGMFFIVQGDQDKEKQVSIEQTCDGNLTTSVGNDCKILAENSIVLQVDKVTVTMDKDKILIQKNNSSITLEDDIKVSVGQSVLQISDSKVSINANEIDIKANNSINIEANNSVSIQGTNTAVKGKLAASLEGTSVNVKADTSLNLKGLAVSVG